MSVRIKFFDAASDKLIDKAIELKLSENQRNEIEKLINDLEDDPYIGEITGNFAVRTLYSIRRHIGNNVHIHFFYDVETWEKETTVVIKSVFLGYLM